MSEGISPGLEAALKRLRPDFELCPHCRRSERVWERCEECDGDGCTEGDDDPDWLGGPRPCAACEGSGGRKICLGRCDAAGDH